MTKAPRTKFLRIKTQWVVIPLMIWLVAEVVVGKLFAHNTRWYEAASSELSSGPAAQALFVGSSRVAAAVDASAADQAGCEFLNHPFHTINVGIGDSNIATHYLGMRDLLDKHPDKLRDVTIFVEAAGGLPDDRSWKDPWQESSIGMFLPYLRLSDFSSVWGSQDSFENKTQVTLRYALKWSNILRRKDKFQQYTFMLNDVKIAPRLAPHAEGAAADMSSEGGIRTDAEAIREVRKKAESFYDRTVANPPAPVDDWDHRVVGDFVRMVHAHGGHVVFFRTPLSSVFKRYFQIPSIQHSAETFDAQAKRWGCPILTVDLPTTDADFPDLWHMRRSLAEEYTRRLMRTWVDRCALPGTKS